MVEYDNRGRILVSQKIVKELNSDKKFVNRNEATQKSIYYGKNACIPDSILVITTGNAKFSEFRYYTYNENRNVLLFRSLKKDENGLIVSTRVDTFFYNYNPYDNKLYKCESTERRDENGSIIHRNVVEDFQSEVIYLKVFSDGKIVEERTDSYGSRRDIFESRHIVCYEMSERKSAASYLELMDKNGEIEYEYYK